MKHFFVTIILLLLLFPATATALERFEIITTAELEQLLKDRETGKADFILVNSLDRIIFRHAAIPGSVNIPNGHLKQHANKLGSDTSKLIIPYCMGYR